MISRIQQSLGEAKNKMNGYVMLLVLRYANLCVKADAMSLLPVSVLLDGDEKNLEEVANVSMVNEKVIAVLPKYPNTIFEIGKGVKKAHPEFKMDMVQNDKSKDEDDKYLTFTMPEVDEDRRDLLNNGVDGLRNQCKAKLDTVLKQCGEKIVGHMKGADPDTINEVKDQLQNLHDFFEKTMEDATNNKKKEIEDAYQLYLKEKQESEKEQREAEEARGEGKGMSMTMNDED